MKFSRSAVLAAVVVLSFSADSAAQSSTGYFAAITDRLARAEPPLPSLPAAGSMVVDPAFGSPVYRMTDRTTRPGYLDRSYRTPSSSHQHSWSVSGRYFYAVSTDGTIVPFVFDNVSGKASRVNPTSTGEGGLVLQFFMEPQFSYVSDNLIYGGYSGSGATLRTVDQYDFNTGLYTRLLNLDLLAPNLAGTYLGWVGSSGGVIERIAAFFGGPSQDYHYLAVVFDKNDPTRRRVINTKASTIDGRPTNIPLNFSIHAMAIDRSGRFAMLYTTFADMSGTRKAAPSYLWDVDTGHITELPQISANNAGHTAYGYGTRVNQSCCTSTTYDAVQWQYRSLDNPFVTRDVIPAVLTPKSVYIAEHASWHNARPDVLVPFVSALYRYSPEPVAWRAWDDEIIGVATDAPAGSLGTVWRFAHHRSDVRSDSDPTRATFWYMPRPSVSDDGKWALFTSNWEKSLGIDPGGDATTRNRQDVFLVRLQGQTQAVSTQPITTEPTPITTEPTPITTEPAPITTAPPPTAPQVETQISIATTSLAPGVRRQAYTATLAAMNANGAVAWRVTSGTLPAGLTLNTTTGVISGFADKPGNSTFIVSATDSGYSATRELSIQIRAK